MILNIGMKLVFEFVDTESKKKKKKHRFKINNSSLLRLEFEINKIFIDHY